MRAIFKALADVVIEASKSGPQMAVEIFDAIEVAVNHLLVMTSYLIKKDAENFILRKTAGY